MDWRRTPYPPQRSPYQHQWRQWSSLYPALVHDEIGRGIAAPFGSITDPSILASWATFFRDQFVIAQNNYDRLSNRHLQLQQEIRLLIDGELADLASLREHVRNKFVLDKRLDMGQVAAAGQLPSPTLGGIQYSTAWGLYGGRGDVVEDITPQDRQTIDQLLKDVGTTVIPSLPMRKLLRSEPFNSSASSDVPPEPMEGLPPSASSSSIDLDIKKLLSPPLESEFAKKCFAGIFTHFKLVKLEKYSKFDTPDWRKMLWNHMGLGSMMMKAQVETRKSYAAQIRLVIDSLLGYGSKTSKGITLTSSDLYTATNDPTGDVMKRALFLNLYRSLKELDFGKSNAIHTKQQFSDSEIDRLFEPFEKAFILTVARKHLTMRCAVLTREDMPSPARIEEGLNQDDLVFLFDLYHRIMEFDEQERRDQGEITGTSSQGKAANKRSQHTPAGDEENGRKPTDSKRLRSDPRLGGNSTNGCSSVIMV